MNNKKDWLATIFGAVAAAGTVASGSGASLGHIGSVSGVQAITSIALLALGWITNKNPQNPQ